eukprot:COSAG02_NODE_1957_length_10261_cov_51.399134_2_plen_71_part_00
MMSQITSLSDARETGRGRCVGTERGLGRDLCEYPGTAGVGCAGAVCVPQGDAAAAGNAEIADREGLAALF